RRSCSLATDSIIPSTNWTVLFIPPLPIRPNFLRQHRLLHRSQLSTSTLTPQPVDVDCSDRILPCVRKNYSLDSDVCRKDSLYKSENRQKTDISVFSSDISVVSEAVSIESITVSQRDQLGVLMVPKI
ncbi:unnamed protein product, partial [Hymenolepis diminuta]